MKHIVLIILFITSFTLVSYAQLDKGTWLTGGSGSFFSYSQDYESNLLNGKTNYTQLNLNGALGYFAIDKLALGLKSSFRYLNSSEGGPFATTRFLFGPNLRYYFLDADKPFNIVTDIDYQTGIFNNPRKGPDYKGKTYSYSAMTGMEAFFNSTVGLELLIGYQRTFEGFINNPEINVDYSDTRSGIFLNIGFKIHLENK
jgi:hypothetical protein